MLHYLSRKLKYGFMLTFAFLTCQVVLAQRTIQGNVKDNNNNPLSGVSITVKGSSAGTTTDANGNYSISVPGNSSVLIFSYVGFPSQEIEVGNKTTMPIISLPMLKPPLPLFL